MRSMFQFIFFKGRLGFGCSEISTWFFFREIHLTFEIALFFKLNSHAFYIIACKCFYNLSAIVARGVKFRPLNLKYVDEVSNQLWFRKQNVRNLWETYTRNLFKKELCKKQMYLKSGLGFNTGLKVSVSECYICAS